MSERQEKVNSLLRNISGSFLRNHVPEGTIVSVTNVTISKDLKRATIFVDIFPEDNEAEILKNLKREEGGLRKYAKTRLTMKFLPRFEFEIDYGIKKERKIDELLG